LVPVVFGCRALWYARSPGDRYLSLDAIEASEPEDLASAKLPFRVVDLLVVF